MYKSDNELWISIWFDFTAFRSYFLEWVKTTEKKTRRRIWSAKKMEEKYKREICIKIPLFMCARVLLRCFTMKEYIMRGKSNDANLFVYIKKQINWRERKYSPPLLIYKHNVTYFFFHCTVFFLILITVRLENEIWILHAAWPIRMVNEKRRRRRRKDMCTHKHTVRERKTHSCAIFL